MRRLSVIFLLVFASCSSSDPQNTNPSDTAPSSDVSDVSDGTNWFQVDSGGDAWVTDSSDKDGMTTSKDGFDKGDGTGKEGGMSAFWEGSIDVEAGTGSFTYVVEEGGKDEDKEEVRLCHIKYPVLGVTEVEACAGCEKAWTFTLGAVSSSENEDLCAKGLGGEGTTHSYGHGTQVLFPEYQINVLHALAGETWVESGLSIFSAPTWTFYIFEGDKDDDGGK